MKKEKLRFEDTHSRQESLSIDGPMTTEQIQAFIDKDYSWEGIPSTRISKEEMDSVFQGYRRSFPSWQKEHEPDWTPDC